MTKKKLPTDSHMKICYQSYQLVMLPNDLFPTDSLPLSNGMQHVFSMETFRFATTKNKYEKFTHFTMTDCYSDSIFNVEKCVLYRWKSISISFPKVCIRFFFTKQSRHNDENIQNSYSKVVGELCFSLSKMAYLSKNKFALYYTRVYSQYCTCYLVT